MREALRGEQAGEGRVARSARHGGCGAAQPKAFSREGLQIFVEHGDDEMVDGDRKRNLSAKEVHDIFKRISEPDMIALGFDPRWSRPEWMLLTVMPVPPPQVRPKGKEMARRRRAQAGKQRKGAP